MALVLRSMWQCMFSGTEGQVLRAVAAALLSTAATVSVEIGVGVPWCGL
jgi:hypothetical protein